MSPEQEAILTRANRYVEAYESTDISDFATLKRLIYQMTHWAASDPGASGEPGVHLRVAFCTCHYHYLKGEYAQAYRLFKATEQQHYGSEDARYLAKLYRLMSLMSYVKGAFANALEMGYKGLEQLKICDDPDEHIRLLMNLGIAYSLVADRTKQMAFFEEALDIAKAHQFEHHICAIYNNIAYTYYLNRDYDACARYIAEAEIRYAPDDMSTQRIALLLTKVSLLHHQRALQEAGILLARVEAHPKFTLDKAIWMDWHLEMARHHRLLGHHEHSAQLLKAALHRAETYQLNDYRLSLLDALTTCAKSYGKLDAALGFQEERRALVNQLTREKDDYQYMLMQVQYEIDQMAQKVSALSNELKDTQESSIYALATLAEYRDEITGKHILRTIRYMDAFIELMNASGQFPPFSEEQRHNFSRSSALHDIGKVGISDLILHKPGPLTAEEFETIKLHTVIGRDALATTKDILGDRTFLSLAMRIAYAHHEKWDGSGYPEGLKGEAIPIEGRMVAIVDVYDALISRRPYKPPYSHAEALEQMAKGRGTHFDPALLDLFLAHHQVFFDIASALQDELGACSLARHPESM